MDHEPKTIWLSAAKLFTERPRDNRFVPRELRPKSRNYVIREQDGERAWDVMSWDVLEGGAAFPKTDVRNFGLKQWRALAANPETFTCASILCRSDRDFGSPTIAHPFRR